MKKIIKNPLALAGLIIILLIAILALFASHLSPYDPNYIDIQSILVSPNKQHIMGTDALGRLAVMETILRRLPPFTATSLWAWMPRLLAPNKPIT